VLKVCGGIKLKQDQFGFDFVVDLEWDWEQCLLLLFVLKKIKMALHLLLYNNHT